MNKTNSKRHKLNVNKRRCEPYLQFLALDFSVQPWTARNTNFSFPPLVLWVFTSKVEDARFLAGTLAQLLTIYFSMLPFIVTRTAANGLKRHDERYRGPEDRKKSTTSTFCYYLQTYLQYIYNYERAKRLEKKELVQPECDHDGGRAVKYETRSSNPRTLVRSHPNLPTKWKTIGRNNTFPLFDISDLQSSFSVENSGKNDFWPIRSFHFN